MSFTVIVAIVFALVALGLFSRLGEQSGGKVSKGRAGDSQYCKQGPLLSPAERLFHQSLFEAVNGQYSIFCKVRLADVLNPKSSGDRSKWQTSFNKISAKHLDFVLCEPESFTVVAGVELDDKSHSSQSAQKRDKVKTDSCESACLPLVRIQAKRRYDVGDIRDRLQAYIPLDPLELSVPKETVCVNEESSDSVIPLVSAKEEPSSASEIKPLGASEPADSTEAAPECPKCGALTTLRTVNKGKNAGKAFWVCSDFPSCRGAIRQS